MDLKRLKRLKRLKPSKNDSKNICQSVNSFLHMTLLSFIGRSTGGNDQGWHHTLPGSHHDDLDLEGKKNVLAFHFNSAQVAPHTGRKLPLDFQGCLPLFSSTGNLKLIGMAHFVPCRARLKP